MSRILIIDDTRDARLLTGKLRTLSHHTVAVAANGTEALEKLVSGFVPDLILLDLQMPVLDGVNFMGAIRSDPRWRSLRVVVFSISESAQDSKRLRELGVQQILVTGASDVEQVLGIKDPV